MSSSGGSRISRARKTKLAERRGRFLQSRYPARVSVARIGTMSQLLAAVASCKVRLSEKKLSGVLRLTGGIQKPPCTSCN